MVSRIALAVLVVASALAILLTACETQQSVSPVEPDEVVPGVEPLMETPPGGGGALPDTDPTLPAKRGRVIGDTDPGTKDVVITIASIGGSCTTDNSGKCEIDVEYGTYVVAAQDASGTSLSPASCETDVTGTRDGYCKFSVP